MNSIHLHTSTSVAGQICFDLPIPKSPEAAQSIYSEDARLLTEFLWHYCPIETYKQLTARLWQREE
jgi:hypothetical protein